MFVIYLLENRLSHKKYVGQTRRPLSERWYHHKYDAKTGSRTPIAKAIRKYGEENFSVKEVTRTTDQTTADFLERFWANTLNTWTRNGYNLRAGQANPVGGNEWYRRTVAQWNSEARHRKHSDAAKRSWSNPTIRANHLAAMDSVWRAKKSEAMLRIWSDPNYKSRQIERIHSDADRISRAFHGPIRLLSPDGTIVSVQNRRRFARENGVSLSGLHYLLRGRFAQLKGWRLAP